VSVNKHPYKVSVHETESSPGIPERGWLDMDVRWLVTKDTVGASNTVFGITYFPPGSRHELHRHPNAEEVEYLISGSGVAYVDDDAVEMVAGDAVFVPRNAYHGFENTTDDEVVMAWCYSGAAGLEEAGFVTRREDEESGGS
jgi:oxalate decarboxylase/phosphoglucose isomerase-like protein (cupin superfamily)